MPPCPPHPKLSDCGTWCLAWEHSCSSMALGGGAEPPCAAGLVTTGRAGTCRGSGGGGVSVSVMLTNIWALPPKSLSKPGSYRHPLRFSSRNFSILVFRWITFSINLFFSHFLTQFRLAWDLAVGYLLPPYHLIRIGLPCVSPTSPLTLQTTTPPASR